MAVTPPGTAATLAGFAARLLLVGRIGIGCALAVELECKGAGAAKTAGAGCGDAIGRVDGRNPDEPEVSGRGAGEFDGGESGFGGLGTGGLGTGEAGTRIGVAMGDGVESSIESSGR
jgi:hypothetical protein